MWGNSARILIRRMKSSIRERKGKCRISQKGDYEYVREKEKKTITTINYT